MIRVTRIPLLLVLVAAQPVRGEGRCDDPVWDARIELNIAVLIREPSGAFKVLTNLEPGHFDARVGGGLSHGVSLKNGRQLLYFVRHDPLKGDKVPIKVTRQMHTQSGKEDKSTPLPDLHAEVDLFGSWVGTLLPDLDGRGTLLVRVTPLIVAEIEDEVLKSDSFFMMVRDGMVLYTRTREGAHPKTEEERVLFEDLAVSGEGIRLGIAEVGELWLAPFPFEGAAPCGWIRGAKLSCSFASGDDRQTFELWSEVPILPEDPRRPLRGWKLFGAIKAPEGPHGSFYGSFRRGCDDASPSK